jgi:hypothetical protein
MTEKMIPTRPTRLETRMIIASAAVFTPLASRVAKNIFVSLLE